MDARLAFPVINTVNRKKEFQNQDLLTALGLLELTLEKENKTIIEEKVKKKKEKKKREGGGISSWRKVVQGVLDYIDDESDDLAMN